VEERAYTDNNNRVSLLSVVRCRACCPSLQLQCVNGNAEGHRVHDCDDACLKIIISEVLSHCSPNNCYIKAISFPSFALAPLLRALVNSSILSWVSSIATSPSHLKFLLASSLASNPSCYFTCKV